MMPVPSTWPKTKWPSSLSRTLRDLSMLTIWPGLTSPRLVRRIVSDTISNSASPFDTFVTVRQAPFMQRLSPLLRSLPNLPVLTLMMGSAPLLLFEIDVTLPVALTIPVNICCSNCLMEVEHIYLQLIYVLSC